MEEKDKNVNYLSKLIGGAEIIIGLAMLSAGVVLAFTKILAPASVPMFLYGGYTTYDGVVRVKDGVGIIQ